MSGSVANRLESPAFVDALRHFRQSTTISNFVKLASDNPIASRLQNPAFVERLVNGEVTTRRARSIAKEFRVVKVQAVGS